MIKKAIFFGLALATMVTILLLPTPEQIETAKGVIELTLAGKATLAVLAMVVILWITEAVPFPIAGLIGMILMVFTRAATFKTLVREGFGNEIVLFFIGVLILSAAISETNLLKRISNHMLYRFGHKPKIILLLFLIIGMSLSAWMTCMATAAIMLPMGVAILKDAKLEPLKSNFGRALMISCAWGPIIGGTSTPAGNGANPLTMTFLKDLADMNFSFLDWMMIGVPASLLMIPCAWFILLKVFPQEKVDLALAEEDFRKKVNALGPVNRQEISTLIIFGLTITLWVCAPLIKVWTGGAISFLSISFVAVTCACLFFLPGINVITWKKAQEKISWGGVVLIATGLAMGMTVYRSGAAAWLSQVCFSQIGMLHPIILIFAIVFGVSLIKVIFSSNTVTGVIMVPLLIALANNLGLDPVLVAIPAGISCSLAFILVTSSPTNVIPYSAGYFSIQDMAKAGVWMTLASSACVTLSIVVMGKLTGIITW